MQILVLSAIGIASSVLAVPSASLVLLRRDYDLFDGNRFQERYTRHLEVLWDPSSQHSISHNSQWNFLSSRLESLPQSASSLTEDDDDIQLIEARTDSKHQRRTETRAQQSTSNRLPGSTGSMVRAGETKTSPSAEASSPKTNKPRARPASHGGSMFRAEDRRQLARVAASSASTSSSSVGSPRLTSPFANARPPVQETQRAAQPQQARPPTHPSQRIPRLQPPIPQTQQHHSTSRQSSGAESIAPKSQLPTPATSRASSTFMADVAHRKQAEMLEQAMEKHFPTQEPEGFIAAGWKASQTQTQKKVLERSRTL